MLTLFKSKKVLVKTIKTQKRYVDLLNDKLDTVEDQIEYYRKQLAMYENDQVVNLAKTSNRTTIKVKEDTL